jgi:ATP-dependent RNA helicase DeaD
MSDISEITGATGSPTVQNSRPAEYVADIGFDDLPIAEELRRAIHERGWEHPTPVQAKAFEPVVGGRDLIVRSKTGTGKTAAFGLPLLQKLNAGERKVKVLVLCPTRELALQVATELSHLGQYKDLRVAAIYGGASMRDQEQALEDGAAVVVGTPGRVADHIRRGNLRLDACNHVVLDEADEMLDQGFYEEVTWILDQLPKDRQVLLFSATVPEDIQRLIARYTTNAETLLMSGDVFTVEHIHHVRYELSDAYPKPRNLIYVLEMEEPNNAIIFCNTRDDTELVTAVLNRNGFDADLLNGDLPQKERERVMGKVKRGEVAFMVATDLAARGIDISDLKYVINYSLPEDPAVYLHRVGRTGRIGKQGTAINLTSGRELATLTALEKRYGVRFERREMPSPEEAARMWTERHVREIRDVQAHTVYDGYLHLAGQIRNRNDVDDLLAFLLKYFFTHHRMERAQAEAQAAGLQREERPRRERAERERPDRERSERRRDRERERREPRLAGAERRERPKHADLEAAPGQVKLWIGLGKADDLDEAGVRSALESLGAPVSSISSLDIRPHFTFAVVPEVDAPAFEALSGKKHGDKTLKVERARPRGEKPQRERHEAREPRPPEPAEEPGQARLWVGLGKSEGLDEAGVQRALEEAGAPAGKVIRVLLRPTFSYVVVADEDVAAFEAISGKAHGEKTLKVERARARR